MPQPRTTPDDIRRAAASAAVAAGLLETDLDACRFSGGWSIIARRDPADGGPAVLASGLSAREALVMLQGVQCGAVLNPARRPAPALP